MKEHRIGIIMNGVTGRMGTNQHLVRSILAIRKQGGVRLPNGDVLLPDPVLLGRNFDKLRALAQQHGVERISVDLDKELRDPLNKIYFDSQTTDRRAEGVRKALAAKRAVYCEKPTATDTATAVALAREADAAGVPHGVVQDKLFLPGLLKLKLLIDSGFFGRILSVRGEFGYWVFEGEPGLQPAQRPSWNYRQQDGGGIIVDMLCHWRYVIDHLFGPVRRVSCLGATHIPRRWDESGQPYEATADDAAYATFEAGDGIVLQFNSSWTVRVRRDDLLTLQVDGTKGSAVAGLREVVIQRAEATPRPTWNPDVPQPIDFFAGWQKVPDYASFDNGFKVQWELFLQHVFNRSPFPWTLHEGAKGVQLAELGLQSWAERRWLDVPAL